VCRAHFSYFTEFPVNGYIRPLSPPSPYPFGSPEWSPLTELPHRKMSPFRSPPFICLFTIYLYVSVHISVGVPSVEPTHGRRRIILIHQAEPLYLVRLNTTGRSPTIPEGAVNVRLTHCHSSLRHGMHTIGLGIVFQGLLL